MCLDSDAISSRAHEFVFLEDLCRQGELMMLKKLFATSGGRLKLIKLLKKSSLLLETMELI